MATNFEFDRKVQVSKYLQQFSERVKGSKMFGVDVWEMSREDLLGMIGWMQTDIARREHNAKAADEARWRKMERDI